MDIVTAIITNDRARVKQILEDDPALFYQPIENMFGEIPVQLAINMKLPDMVKVITEVHKGSRFIFSSEPPDYYKTPLMHATCFLDDDIMVEMIDALNVVNNLDATVPRMSELPDSAFEYECLPTITDETPLYTLCSRKMFDVVAHLLTVTNARETINIECFEEFFTTKTPLWWAANNCANLTRMMLQYGADPFKCCINILDSNKPGHVVVAAAQIQYFLLKIRLISDDGTINSALVKDPDVCTRKRVKKARMQATSHDIYIDREEAGVVQPSVVVKDDILSGVVGMKKEMFVELTEYLV